MAEGKREDRDEQPQEEYVNEGTKDDPGNKPDSVKYDQWSTEELKRKAEKNNIAGYDKLDRNELIKNLKQL